MMRLSAPHFFILILVIVLIVILINRFVVPQMKEKFAVWDYEYELTPFKYRDLCPMKGTIEEINPTAGYCFSGYYIPSIYNVGTYVSEVNTWGN